MPTFHAANRRPAAVQWAFITAFITVLAALSACGTNRGPAPVEERSANARPVPVRLSASQVPSSAAPSASSVPSTPADAAKVLPGAENAGKPGYYTVKSGDTLIRIALDNGQNWKDLAKWNNLDNPNLIEVGQVLRVAPPGVEVVAQPVVSGKSESRVVEAKPPAGAASAASTAVAPTAPTPTTAREDEPVWQWPTSGPVIYGFDEGKSKGLGLGGKAGDPVFAAADARVVYAGNGLRGYGNLIILKHNSTYLTAYAHNQTLLVKEEQTVKRGQKIAEMGSSDAERVQLHFEVRRQGKPVDPSKLLPAR